MVTNRTTFSASSAVAAVLFSLLLGPNVRALDDAHGVRSDTLMLLPGMDFRLDLADEEPARKPPWWSAADWPREKKVVALNVATIGAIAAIGFAGWDYGSQSFHAANEGWFDPDTPYGGADKLGHVFTCYALASVYNRIYKDWGYPDNDAIFMGAASSWLTMTVIEIGDGFSNSQGFAWQDEVMNTVGVGMAYLRHRFPAVRERCGFALGVVPFAGRPQRGAIRRPSPTTRGRSFCSPSSWTAGSEPAAPC